MTAQLIKQDGQELTIQVTVNISGRMLHAEDSIQQAVNEVGCLATQQTLKKLSEKTTMQQPIGLALS